MEIENEEGEERNDEEAERDDEVLETEEGNEDGEDGEEGEEGDDEGRDEESEEEATIAKRPKPMPTRKQLQGKGKGEGKGKGKAPSRMIKGPKGPAAPQKADQRKMGVIPFKIGYSSAGKARRRLMFDDEVGEAKPAVNQMNHSIKPKLSPKGKSLADRSNQPIKQVAETATISKMTRRSPPSALRFSTESSASLTPSPPPPIKKRKKETTKKEKKIHKTYSVLNSSDES